MESRLNQRKFLFICGIARSGTTALARVVNAHESIAIGLERFKSITRGDFKSLLTPELYDEESFFDFADGHTNLCPDKSDSLMNYYQDVRRKFPQLEYIGDKVPNSFRLVEHIHSSFPRTKHVFIVRDLFETAHSWQTRADNPTDNWATHKDATYAVYPWNETILTYLRMKEKFPDDFYVVDYNAFFNVEESDFVELDKLCRFLDIEADSSMRHIYSHAVGHYASRVKQKDRELPKSALDYIYEHANFDAYVRAVGSDESWESMQRKFAA